MTLSNCAVNLAFVEDYDYIEGHGMSIPFVLTKKFSWDGKSQKRHPLYNIYMDSNWKLMMFHINNKTFYLSFVFLASRSSYIIYIIDASVNERERFIAKVWMEEVFKENPERKDYYVQVTPLEELVNLESHLPNTNYVVIPYQEMKKFFAITLNDEDERFPTENGKYSICMPIQVEDVKRIIDDNIE